MGGKTNRQTKAKQISKPMGKMWRFKLDSRKIKKIKDCNAIFTFTQSLRPAISKQHKYPVFPKNMP